MGRHWRAHVLLRRLLTMPRVPSRLRCVAKSVSLKSTKVEVSSSARCLPTSAKSVRTLMSWTASRVVLTENAGGIRGVVGCSQ